MAPLGSAGETGPEWSNTVSPWRVLVQLSCMALSLSRAPVVLKARLHEGAGVDEGLLQVPTHTQAQSVWSWTDVKSVLDFSWKTTKTASLEAKAEKTKQPLAQLLLRPFNKAKLPTVELEDGTLPVGPVLDLGNLLPESQQPKLPADFCQELDLNVVVQASPTCWRSQIILQRLGAQTAAAEWPCRPMQICKIDPASRLQRYNVSQPCFPKLFCCLMFRSSDLTHSTFGPQVSKLTQQAG